MPRLLRKASKPLCLMGVLMGGQLRCCVTSGRSCAGSVQLIGVPLRIDEAHQRLNAWYRGHPLRHRREPLPNVDVGWRGHAARRFVTSVAKSLACWNKKA